ncbi:MAG TPA: hypothetical protein VN026_15385 [Bacteroidia bacterium]|nr:hypothetical protein [Bacteroidia bacterium]
MKRLLTTQLLVLASFLISLVGFSQPAGLGHWKLGGNSGFPPPDDVSIPGNNFFGTQTGFNIPINFETNGFNRMIINNGGNGINDGRIAMGENLPTGFVPQARLHLHQGFNLGLNDPHIRFTNVGTGASNTDGFTIGNSTQIFPITNNGDVQMIQYETAPIIMFAPNTSTTGYSGPQPAEMFRIQNGQTFLAAATAPIRITDGYVGLNQPAPRAHIEMITPAFPGGEEFFMAKPSDIFDPPSSTTTATNVQMGMMNLTSVDKQFLPGVFGNINQSAQSSPALEMIGGIPIAQDIPINPAVMRFIVGRDWIINGNTAANVGSAPTNSVINRPIFSWSNANSLYMYMNANGRLRIGSALSTSNPSLTAFRANNRIEISADIIDPYFNAVGNPGIGNPNTLNNFGSCSGLRFTILTSNDLVIAPDATNQIDPSKVLSVDKNGDVVAIYPALGAICTNTAQIAAQTFSASRAINQGTFNMEWRGQGRNGFGTNNCTVGNRVEITGLTSFSATSGGNSGLRFTNMTSTTTAITNPTTKVLSVNSNGDVILVTDQTGTVVGSGSITAQNGLSLVGTNTVELGGTLIHPLTVINFSTNTLQYTDAATLHYQRGANGGVWQSADGANNKDGQASFSDFAYVSGAVSAVGRVLNVIPISSSVAAGGLIGDQVFVIATPTAGGGITGNTYGYFATTQNTASPMGNNYAVAGWAQGAALTSTAINAGFFARANGSQNNYGYYADISNGSSLANEDNGVRINTTSNAGTPTNRGGYFKSLYGQNVYGLWAHGEGGTATNYGIYAEAVANGTLNIGVFGKAAATGGTVGPNYAGYFQGDVVKTGNDNFTSDLNLKQNVDTIPNAIGIINSLQPITFDYKISSYPSMNLPSGIQYGVGGQPTKVVLPQIVNTITHPAQLDSLGNITVPSFTYLAVEYQQITPILIRVAQVQQAQLKKQDAQIKKQDSTIQAIQSQIAALTSSVTSCCSSTAVRTTKPNELNQLDINLSDKDIVVLNQNVPNPFAEQTTITYNVPEKYNFAQIIFSTVEGKIIKAVDITKKGKGQLNVFANDLSTGFYTYTLVVDGKTIDTKKMVKSE